MNGLHKHFCLICNEEVECQQVTHCSRLRASICFREHTREILEAHLKRTRDAHNKEIRDMERDARDAYAEGNWQGRQERDS
jgi:hypothetical protein